MWRKTACAAAGLALAIAAASTLTPTISAALTPAKAIKGDRLPVKAIAPAGAYAISFNLPDLGMTVVAKNPPPPPVVSAVRFPRTPPAYSVQPMEKPAIAQKPKLPEGCEPPFSPVTVPAMAHVASRCTS